MLCVLFTQKTLCSPIKNHFRIYKHVLEGQYIVLTNFSCSENFQFRKKAANLYQELFRNFGKQDHIVKVVKYIECPLQVYWVGEFFSSLQMYTQTKGRPFWGGYVCSRGCLSNLRMLMEDAIFNTKYHLLSLQEFIWKGIVKCSTVEKYS